MPALDSEMNIVEALRSKTEESDIKLYLKSTMGGYTKNSVLELSGLLLFDVTPAEPLLKFSNSSSVKKK